MIQISSLDDSSIGKRVLYRQAYFATERAEYGVITSWNELYIFILFDKETHPKGCQPHDLSFIKVKEWKRSGKKKVQA